MRDSKRLKKVILGILTLVLIFVWWDNLKMFAPSGSHPSSAPSDTANVVTEVYADHQLGYKPPRINPFYHQSVDQQKQRSTPKSPVQEPAVRPATPSGTALLGILRRGSASQAVIRGPDGRSTVLSLDDSLAGWKLTIVAENYVVFRHLEFQDTIWLSPSAR